MKLSDTQRAILEAAAAHPERRAIPPERLPAGALQKIADALLRRDLVTALPARAYAAAEAWQVEGVPHLLQITDEGFRAIGQEPPADEDDEQSPAAIARRNAERRAAEPAQDAPPAAEPGPEQEDAPAPEAAQDAPAPAPRASLRDAAAAFLAAWDASPAQDATDNPISRAVEGLRAALAGKPATRATGAPRKPREGTKQDAVLALLRRPEGATVAQIADATGWAPHTVRGFFAGLKKKGTTVEAIERVRQVGPNREGARGSYTVYQVKTEG